MAQVTIYLPDDVAQDVKARARRAKKSVSAYLAALAAGGDDTHDWPRAFLETFGSWKGKFPQIHDPPPEPAPKW